MNMKVKKKTLSLFAAGMALTCISCPQNPDVDRPDNSQGGNESGTKPSDKMNIILFMVDDMGVNDTSVPFLKNGSELNQYYYTPNMQKLAKKGVRFTRAYAHPVSSPSRVSLMTGVNASRHRVTNWTLNLNENTDAFPSGATVNGQDWNWNGISPDAAAESNVYEATCFPEILSANGYRTIHLGKAHWGAVGTKAAEPLNLGFDVNIGGCAAGGLDKYAIQNAEYPYTYSNGAIQFPNLNLYAKKESGYHITDAITEAAKSEIDKAVKDQTPFYLYMSHYAVHTPHNQDNRFLSHYEGKTGPGKKDYGTLVTGMDQSLGHLMDYLEEKKIVDKTIIIFMADNGGHHSATNRPLKGSKGGVWEGGIREPMMVYWPGVTDSYAGGTNKTPVIIEDFYPAILEMAGIAPEKYMGSLKQKTLDGVSFVEALKTAKTVNADRPLIFHFPNWWGEATDASNTMGVPVGKAASAVIAGNYKYLYFYDDKASYLYDIVNDETEQNALSDEAKKQEMAKLLSDYLKERNATMVYDKNTRIVTYPDGTTEDLSVYQSDNGVFYIDFNNQKGSLATVPPAAAGSHEEFVSGQDTFKVTVGTDIVTGTVSYEGSIKPNGPAGLFNSTADAGAYGDLFSLFTGETLLSDRYFPVWGDAITLETDKPSVTVNLTGIGADDTYEIRLLSVRNNNYYGQGQTVINASYDITAGTVTGTPAAAGRIKADAADISSNAVPGENGRFTVLQNSDGTDVWGFCFTWRVKPTDGQIELQISGVCSIAALRIEKI